jgi:hypothetical protein
MEIININNIQTDKPKLLLYLHLGFGDLINMSGAIRHLSKTYQITITTLSNNLNNAKILFDDINDISFLVTEYFYKDKKEEYDEINKLYDNILKVGLHIKDCYSKKIPIFFYEQLNIDFSNYKKKFIKKSIHNDNFELIKNTKYIFLHTMASNYEYTPKIITDYLIICPNKNMYNKDHKFFELAQLFINLPFFEYTDIIENASELHLINSSFFCYSLLLDLKANIKKCYCRDRPLDYLDNTWYYIFYLAFLFPNK